VNEASKEFQPVSFELLLHENKLRDSPDHIEKECSRHVVVSYCLDVFVSPRFLHEVEHDLEKIDYVDDIFYLDQ
jgi:hypothetical protein